MGNKLFGVDFLTASFIDIGNGWITNQLNTLWRVTNFAGIVNERSKIFAVKVGSFY